MWFESIDGKTRTWISPEELRAIRKKQRRLIRADLQAQEERDRVEAEVVIARDKEAVE